MSEKKLFQISVIILLLLLTFTVLTSTIIAQQMNESNYSTTNKDNNYSMINESNYLMKNETNYSIIPGSENGTTIPKNKTANLTVSYIINSRGELEKVEELKGEVSNIPTLLNDEKDLAVKTAKKQANMEPILKMILDSDYHPSSKVIKLAGKENQYNAPPDFNDTALLKIYVSNESTESLYGELKTLGTEIYKYYPRERFIKARVPINNATKIALLPEVIDVRRTMNFPLTSHDYNVRVENGKQYYHVFLNVENHTSNSTIVRTLENLGVKIKKQYNNEIADFRAYIPVENLTKVAELPFVTHIEYCDIPVEAELYISKKMTDVDYVRDNLNPGLNGSGVTLAVIDSGIDHHQPYLSPPVYELDVRDNWPDGSYAEDTWGHGTHVAGIIANNYSAPPGYEGVAPGVQLAVIKALGDPGPLGNVAQQVYDAIDHAVNDANAQVISMSLGISNINSSDIVNCDGTSMWEQQADWAARNGAIFVNSAGNDGTNGTYTITNPATTKDVIAVGATTDWYGSDTNVTVNNALFGENIDRVAYYSSMGYTGDNGQEHGRVKPEVVAPGGTKDIDCANNTGDGVVSARGKTDDQSSYLKDVNGSCTYLNNNLYRLVGTSMAAPQVAGMAALIIQYWNFTKSDMNAAIVKAMIIGSGIDIGPNGLYNKSVIGYGKVDLYQAIGYNNLNRINWHFGNSLNSSGDDANYTFTVPNNNTYHYIKATIVWNDPSTDTTNSSWGALKNDIDIKLIDPNGNQATSSTSFQQNIEQINYYSSSGIASGNWKLQAIAGTHWDSTQVFGGSISLYTDKPSVNVAAVCNKSNVSAGDKIQITATVNNTGGETASGVIASIGINSPPGSSLYDNFTLDSGYEKTLLGNIPPLGSRTVSWNLTINNSIPTTIFGINVTYSNSGSTTNDTVVLNSNLSNWGYRKKIVITGTSAGSQTNYPMKLTVYNSSGSDTPGAIHLGGNVRSDFGDLRFTKSDGITPINYWIESYTSGVSAVVWVDVDSIPASPSKTDVHLYYGNSSATSASNSAATFTFFDDFNNLNNWMTNISTNYAETLSPSISNGEVTINTNSYESNPYGSYAIEKTNVSFNPNVAIRTRFRGASWYYPGGFGFGVYKGYPPYGVTTNTVQKGIYTAGQFMFLCGKNGTRAYTGGYNSDGNYHIWDLIWTPTRTELYGDGTSLGNSTNVTTIPTGPLNLGIGDMGQYGGGWSYSGMTADWILVRNCVNPEPTWA